MPSTATKFHLFAVVFNVMHFSYQKKKNCKKIIRNKLLGKKIYCCSSYKLKLKCNTKIPTPKYTLKIINNTKLNKFQRYYRGWESKSQSSPCRISLDIHFLYCCDSSFMHTQTRLWRTSFIIENIQYISLYNIKNQLDSLWNSEKRNRNCCRPSY